MTQKISERDQEVPQSYTVDQPTAMWGIEQNIQSLSEKTVKVKQCHATKLEIFPNTILTRMLNEERSNMTHDIYMYVKM